MSENTNEPSIEDLRVLIATPEKSEKEVPAGDAAGKPAAVAKTAPATESGKRSEEGTPAVKTGDEEDETPVSPGVQKRIDKAIGKQREAERKLAAALAEKPGSPPAKETAQTPAVAEGKPNSNDPKYKTYDEYIEDLATWTAKKEHKQLEAQRTNEQSEAKNREHWTERIAAATVLHPDYESVIADSADIKISPAMHEALVTSDIGPQLIYHLAKNPAEAERIAKLTTSAGQMREIGKLEDKLMKQAEAASKPAAPQTAAKTLPKPPAKAIGGTASPGSVDLNDESLDQAVFNREFKKRLANK